MTRTAAMCRPFTPMPVAPSSSAPVRWGGAAAAGALALALALAGAGSAAAAGAGWSYDPEDPPEGLFSEDWMEVHVFGQKSGFAHVTFSRKGGRVLSRQKVFLQVERAGVQIKMTTLEQTEETVGGVPIRFSNSVNQGGVPVSVEGLIGDGEVVVSSRQGGGTKREIHPFEDGSLMAWGLTRAGLLKGLAPGTAYRLKAYVPNVRQDGSLEMSTRVEGEETVEVGGRPVKGTRVVQTLLAPAEIESVIWLDAAGRLLRMKIDLPGLPMEMVRTTQGDAVAPFVPPEVFLRTFVPVGRAIPAGAREVVYGLRFTGRGAAPEFPDDIATQAVERERGGGLRLTVRRPEHRRFAGRPAGSAGAEYLASNVMIDLEDPALAQLSRRAVNGANDAITTADQLRRFVSGFIVDKTLGVGFATASEVAAKPEGDCSEHGILLAALGRFHRLPSRVVSGLVYLPAYGGREHVMGYHMWTQFRIDDQWVDFDAALGESECAPTRIALSTASLRDASLGELGLHLATVLGQLEIEVISVDGDGR